MKVSDDLYLHSIKEGFAYRDKKSLEKSTGIIKPKYKLAGKPISILETYSFFLIHSEDSACIKALTLCVRRAEWEKRNKKYLFYLANRYSYIDINKCEILTKKILLIKIKDRRNKFPYIAKLCDAKHEELKKIPGKLENGRYREKLSQETKQIIGAALDVPDKLRRKLGL